MGVETQNLSDFTFTVVQKKGAYKKAGQEEKVLTDDAVFDEAFILKSNNATRAKAVFSTKIRASLLAAGRQRPLGVLSAKTKHISYFEPGVFYNRKAPLRYVQFGEMLNLLCDVAERVEQSADEKPFIRQ